MGKLKLWSLLFFMLLGSSLYSQVSDNSTPASFGFTTKSKKILPHVLLDSVFVTDKIAQDTKLGIPNRYGIVQKVDINIREEGAKTKVKNMTVWQYEIRCPDAVSLGVNFKTYNLPPGARVYIYSSDKTKIRGGFSCVNNKANKQLTIADFKENKLIIEYNEPDGVEFPGELIIGSISKAYVGLQSDMHERIQINCPEGDNWQAEKRSVCRMTFNDHQYSYYCTGALVNNVRHDKSPYFLTANHCISTNDIAGTLVTYFNYENSSCDNDDALLNQTLSGATMVATNSHSDFALLKLAEYPPDDYLPYFAGWNANSNDKSENGTCIHHPRGSTKCIAIDQDALGSCEYAVTWDNNTQSEANTHWKVAYDVGTDEKGSSGSPLFDENKRIIGQLHGGNDIRSLFGKLSLSWNYSSASSEQLKKWLDPDNTGISILDGMDYNSLPRANFSADVSIACLSTVVSLTDESLFTPDEWLWLIEPQTYEFSNRTNKHSQNPDILFTADGTYSITLIATNENGADTIIAENSILATTDLPVAFQNLPDELTLCGSELQDYQMIAEGAVDYQFELTNNDFFNIETHLDTLGLTLKDDVRQYGSFDTYVKVTGSNGDCAVSDSVWIHVLMPKNDDAKHAVALTLGNNASYNNECGTAENDEPYPATSGCFIEDSWCLAPTGSSVLDNSIWFTFSGTSNNKITIETEGFDTQIAVYEADSYTDLLSGNSLNYSLLAAGDNQSSSGTAAVIEDLSVEPGKTYWLQVDGNNGDYGDLVIRLLSSTIEVYPNPSDGIFHITVSSIENGEAELSVYSLTGQRIYTHKETITLDSNTIDMNLSGNPSGMYLFRASINGLIMSKKLILTH